MPPLLHAAWPSGAASLPSHRLKRACVACQIRFEHQSGWYLMATGHGSSTGLAPKYCRCRTEAINIDTNTKTSTGLCHRDTANPHTLDQYCRVVRHGNPSPTALQPETVETVRCGAHASRPHPHPPPRLQLASPSQAAFGRSTAPRRCSQRRICSLPFHQKTHAALMWPK